MKFGLAGELKQFWQDLGSCMGSKGNPHHACCNYFPGYVLTRVVQNTLFSATPNLLMCINYCYNRLLVMKPNAPSSDINRESYLFICQMASFHKFTYITMVNYSKGSMFIPMNCYFMV